jgi:GNAT superfamily N-acetyltransferase
MIRPATLGDMRLLLDWAAEEGWNPGLRDAAPFHAADPAGFLLAEIDGQPVGCISAVRQGEGFGFIGFYIMRPAWRGRGIGLQLWQAGMDRLAGRVVGLDGVVAQQANYRRSGFVLAWNNARFLAEAPGPVPLSPQGGAEYELLPAAGLPLPDLMALDVFPTPRADFLRHWMAEPGHRALAVLRDGQAQGFGMIRPARQGHRIGPLLARDPAAARFLFNALLAGATGPVSLDLPLANAAAVALAEQAGMRPVFDTARMYAGPAPTLAVDRIFGVASFELG